MKYLYVGQVLDVLNDGESEVLLYPDSEVEIPDNLQALPYFQRLFTSGLLKAISPADSTSSEAA